MSTIALTGGGTAGHIIPSIALLDELYRYYDRVIFVGSTKELDRRIVESYGLPFFAVESVAFSRSSIIDNVKIPFALSRGVRAAKDIFCGEKPSVLFAKGGYASLPSAYAARSLDVPIVVHESDYSLGLANKIISGFAHTTLTSFPETAGGIYVGSPVRPSIMSADKQKARTKYGLQGYPVVTFCGGSLGAQAINDVVRASLDALSKSYHVVHLSGNGYVGTPHRNYTELGYAEDIFDIFAASDVVVSRGGANTLAELASLGKRTIVIPLPKGNSRGDQEENALSYKKRGYVHLLPQHSLTPETLLQAISSALKQPAPTPMPTLDVNKRIVEYIVKAGR